MGDSPFHTSIDEQSGSSYTDVVDEEDDSTGADYSTMDWGTTSTFSTTSTSTVDTSGSIEQEAAEATDPYRAEDLQDEAERAATGQTSLFTADVSQEKSEEDAVNVSAGGSTVTATDDAFSEASSSTPDNETMNQDLTDNLPSLPTDALDGVVSNVQDNLSGVGAVGAVVGGIALVAVLAGR